MRCGPVVKTRSFLFLIFRVICLYRESKKLLDEFIFQLLGVFVSSLAHSHSDPSAIGAAKACLEVS